MVESESDNTVVREDDGTLTITVPSNPKEEITTEVAIMRKLDAMHHILIDTKVGMEIIRTRLTAIELDQSYIRLELGTTRAKVAQRMIIHGQSKL